jgi:L-amino acid N-acyltransferase YncA
MAAGSYFCQLRIATEERTMNLPFVSRPDATIRHATAEDASRLADIYNPYVLTTTVTFEEAAIGPADMAARIAEAADARLPFLVAVVDGSTVAFASASRWKGRCAYRYSAETTVYVMQGHWQRGLGRALYSTLLDLLQRSGCHAAIGGIALPNEPSIRLHERLGFEQVAQFREVGFKFDRWIDVGYWQRLLT